MNSSGMKGTKDPVVIKPTPTDSTRKHESKTNSANEEYNQSKIDSIKKNKVKPKNRTGGKNE
jgi:hypothetical protein